MQWLRSRGIRLHQTIAGSRFRPFHNIFLWILTVIVATIFGTTFATAADRLPSNNRIVVGDTAGSLSLLIEIDDSRILIGGGESRSHAANLVGRSTRPWDRTVDLLLVPGTDETHVLGSIGLVERSEVEEMAIIGVPGNDPIWTRLEREALSNDIELRYLEGEHELQLGDAMLLNVVATDTRTTARISHGSVIVRYEDSISGTDFDSTTHSPHISIQARPTTAVFACGSSVAVMPEPFSSDDIQPSGAEYRAEVPRDGRIVMKLGKEQGRLPLGSVTQEPTSTDGCGL